MRSLRDGILFYLWMTLLMLSLGEMAFNRRARAQESISPSHPNHDPQPRPSIDKDCRLTQESRMERLKIVTDQTVLLEEEIARLQQEENQLLKDYRERGKKLIQEEYAADGLFTAAVAVPLTLTGALAIELFVEQGVEIGATRGIMFLGRWFVPRKFALPYFFLSFGSKVAFYKIEQKTADYVRSVVARQEIHGDQPLELLRMDKLTPYREVAISPEGGLGFLTSPTCDDGECGIMDPELEEAMIYTERWHKEALRLAHYRPSPMRDLMTWNPVRILDLIEFPYQMNRLRIRRAELRYLETLRSLLATDYVRCSR